ncbi:SDR family NAD(P)-dependent oxidoreductase [Streptomyces sp. NPDC058001]|uniref:SDR family NAD(P)-dependent oxidoreductase n=1 Tax=Streptomyces sp. NPDC058001 TaxID=3346300 RepID=UPI0036EB4BF7
MGDAARVVALRSRVLRRLSGLGGMVSIAAGQDGVRELLQPWAERLSVAAVNGPVSTVVSGDADALDELLVACEGRGVRARRVPVDYASHSAHVDLIREELAESLAPIAPVSSRVPFFSTVTGDWIDTAELNADYWFANLRQTVRFEEATRALLDQGFGVFIESSAHPVLATGITETVDAGDAPGVAIGSLRRDEGGMDRFLTSVAEAFVHGVQVEWTSMLPGGRQVDLPTYAFQRKHYWLESTAPEQDDTNGLPTDAADTRFWEAVESENLDELTRTLDSADARSALETLVPALASWRKQRREHSAVDSWRYRIGWRPAQISPRPDTVLSGTWLLVVPAAHREHPWVVAAGEVLGGGGAEVGMVVLDAARPERQSWAGQLGTVAGQINGVLSFLALDEAPSADHPGVPAGLGATLTLLQALGDADVEAPLWCATQGAVSVNSIDPLTRPVQAQTWGLGRVAGLEHPDRWGGLVDLPATVDARSAGRLRTLLAEPGDEDQLALRPSGAFVRRLTRAPLEDTPPVREWRPDVTTLITGGTGGLGGHVSRWLAAQGAEHLVLTSRRGPDADGAAELRAELAELGARVTIVACDASDRDALAALLRRLRDEGTPVRSVVHTAGVAGRFTALADADLADLAETLGAKAGGATALDELLGQDDEVDAFVLFSSNAGVWGGAGQGPYAAANAYLDALAEQRRARGAAATSVAWGMWSGQGLVADQPGVEEALRRLGLKAMDPDLAITALHQALDRDETTLSVTDMDWDRFVSVFTAARPRPLLDELPEAVRILRAAEAGREEDSQSRSALAEQLAGMAPGEQHRLLVELVRAQAATVLGHDSGDAVDQDRQFQDLGFNSVSAVELRNRLNEATGLRLPASLVFDHPTPAALARRIRAEVLGEAEEPAAAGLGGPAVGDALADDAVAIVGMSCRLPGGVESPDDLWRIVVEGRDVIADLPTDRAWDAVERLRELGMEMPGGRWLRKGGFIDTAAEFDPDFFGVSTAEALAMDPQQRLLLEMSWEAVERAGIDPHTLRGSATGVYVGTFFQPYWAGSNRIAEDVKPFLGTGVTPTFASGRISYLLGLEGPTFTVDTGCSSSAVALHQACQAVRRGECSSALVGGVTVLSSPMGVPDLGGMAEDGRCKAFSAEADGTGWGEGAALVMIERLSEARRLGHPVLAVIRGSAVNHNGESNGMSAPNGPSQQRLIRQALADARLSPHEVDAVEAHGTGTPLGDPIEAQALLATYGRDRVEDRPLWLGTVKTNIGHPQAASGLVGVIKMVLAMRHGLLPRSLYADSPTPQVDWASGGVSLLAENTPWPENGRPRRAGVSSFGASGTKAHIILEQDAQLPDVGTPEPAADTDGRPAAAPLLVSARTPDGIRQQAHRLREFVGTHPEAGLTDLAWSLATTRSAFEHRAALFAADREELLGGLAALECGDPLGRAIQGEAVSAARTTFVFAGHALPQSPAPAAQQLYEALPDFADALDEACVHLDACAQLDRPAQEFALGAHQPEDAVTAACVAFAHEAALSRVLPQLGVMPDVAVGHRLGEITAAHAAGLLGIEDAAALLVAVARLRNGTADREAAVEGFRRTAKNIAPHPARLRLVSALTDEPLGAEQLLDPGHWLDEEALSDVPSADGSSAPRVHGVFVGLPDDGPAEAVTALLRVLARAHVDGVAVDWHQALTAVGAQGRPVELPTYPFRRDRYWLEANPVAVLGDALAGKNVSNWSAVEGVELLDETTRKEVVEEYFRRLNAGDLDKVLEMLAPDVRMEDPVGGPPKVGREAVGEYIAQVIEAKAEITIGPVVAAQDGVRVALPLVGRLAQLGRSEGPRMEINCVDVIRINGDGLIEEVLVFWGMTDIAR